MRALASDRVHVVGIVFSVGFSEVMPSSSSSGLGSSLEFSEVEFSLGELFRASSWSSGMAMYPLRAMTAADKMMIGIMNFLLLL